MFDHTVPTCPCCSSAAIGIPRQRKIVCSGCGLAATGRSYLEARDDWCRRAGHGDHQLVCDSCGRQSTTHYDEAGGECFFCQLGHYQKSAAVATSEPGRSPVAPHGRSVAAAGGHGGDR